MLSTGTQLKRERAREGERARERERDTHRETARESKRERERERERLDLAPRRPAAGYLGLDGLSLLKVDLHVVGRQQLTGERGRGWVRFG